MFVCEFCAVVLPFSCLWLEFWCGYVARKVGWNGKGAYLVHWVIVGFCGNKVEFLLTCTVFALHLDSLRRFSICCSYGSFLEIYSNPCFHRYLGFEQQLLCLCSVFLWFDMAELLVNVAAFGFVCLDYLNPLLVRWSDWCVSFYQNQSKKLILYELLLLWSYSFCTKKTVHISSIMLQAMNSCKFIRRSVSHRMGGFHELKAETWENYLGFWRRGSRWSWWRDQVINLVIKYVSMWLCILYELDSSTDFFFYFSIDMYIGCQIRNENVPFAFLVCILAS